MGGNVEGVLQVKNTTKNDFGEKISTYIDYKPLNNMFHFPVLHLHKASRTGMACFYL